MSTAANGGPSASATTAIAPTQDGPAPSLPSEELYTLEARHRGVLPFREFVRDLRSGVKYSKAERKRRYGTSTTPIPVPLFPGETEDEYEQEYQKWMAVRGIAAQPLKPIQNRSFRTDFATKRAMWYRGDPRTSTLHPDHYPPLENLSVDALEQDHIYERTHVTIKEYKLWLKFGFFEKLNTLSPAQIYDRFDMVIPPIYVPLASGETPEMYEERFVTWLAKAPSTTLEELAAHPDRFEERKFRVRFAALNGNGAQKFVPPPKAKRAGDSMKAIEPLAKKLKLSGDEELEDGEVMEVDEEPMAKPTEETATEEPKDSCPGRESIGACVECGCKQCLVRGSQLLREMEAASSNNSIEPKSPRDSVAASIISLARSRPTAEELHNKIAHRLSPSAKERVQPMIDPIEVKLTSEYEAINERIVAEERVLEASASQLALAPVTNLDETNQRLEENKQRQERIENETVRRTTALSVLCVYLWRNEMSTLVAMVNDPQAANVGRIQRVAHHKCAHLSSRIKRKRQEAADLKALLDAVMASESPDGSDFEATNAALSELGTTLGTAERELKELNDQQREEYATLIRSDEGVRSQIQQLIPNMWDNKSKQCD